MKLTYSGYAIDIGNTSTRIDLFLNGKEVDSINTSTHLLKENALIISNFIKNQTLPITYCSVVPYAENSLKKFAIFKNVQLFNLCYNSIQNIKIAYPKPHEIGQDRLANIIASYYLKKSPCILIDVGTATTFDVISEENGYIGGIITPGPQGFLDFLNQNTALLPKLKLNEDFKLDYIIGKSTEEAMLHGTIIGFPAMIIEILDSIKNELKGKQPSVIITGGNGKILNIKGSSYLPNITTLGLAIAYQTNSVTTLSQE